ncbi:Os09g0272550 [Oryza sativa Japonica Group]|uniref:Os09g0272550 protein n=1 Tax=Oryza sativa subsp. japonica TaxID=39947 RepID=A0A0N7KQG8_ORYSJ|nr:Os09g0272550 [Oryza sativa Japonica Group]
MKTPQGYHNNREPPIQRLQEGCDILNITISRFSMRESILWHGCKGYCDITSRKMQPTTDSVGSDNRCRRLSKGTCPRKLRPRTDPATYIANRDAKAPPPVTVQPTIDEGACTSDRHMSRLVRSMLAPYLASLPRFPGFRLLTGQRPHQIHATSAFLHATASLLHH